MNTPKISVIIPIYNSEKYLRRCLDSICLQTYENLEILCINDGSTDSSESILQEYAQKDNRIKIYTQPNSGQSSARNKGLEQATGDYISFIDSDDYIALCLYKKCVDIVSSNDIDIYMFNYVQYREDQEMTQTMFNFGFNIGDWKINEKHILSPQDCLNPFVGNMSVANKIYSKKFLDRIGIKFIEKMIFEDRLFHFTTLFSAKSIYLNNDIHYWYREVKDSTMHTLGKNTFDIFKVLNMMKEVLKRENQFESLKYLLLQFEYRYLYFLINKIEPQYGEEFFTEIQKELKTMLENHCPIEESQKLKDFEICKKFLD